MIIEDKKIVFIHIPKTGGTSIEKLFINNADLKDVPNKHQDYNFYKNRLNTKNYAFLSFVRNPWDLVLSQYLYMWKSNFSWPTRWRSSTSLDLNLSFSDWIKSERFLLTSPDTDSFDLKGNFINKNQIDWILDGDKIANNLFIGRFENLQKDYSEFCVLNNLKPSSLPRTNSTNRKKHYSSFYDAEMVEIVFNKYKKDIVYFNYNFGE